jgi:DnaJ-class molecular chaperone
MITEADIPRILEVIEKIYEEHEREEKGTNWDRGLRDGLRRALRLLDPCPTCGGIGIAKWHYGKAVKEDECPFCSGCGLNKKGKVTVSEIEISHVREVFHRMRNELDRPVISKSWDQGYRVGLKKVLQLLDPCPTCGESGLVEWRCGEFVKEGRCPSCSGDGFNKERGDGSSG